MGWATIKRQLLLGVGVPTWDTAEVRVTFARFLESARRPRDQF